MNLGDFKVAWVLWSTKALVAVAEAGELAGGILVHQARRLEHAAGRRLARIIDAEREPPDAPTPGFSDPQHGAGEP